MLRARSFLVGLGLVVAAAPAVAQDLARPNARGELTVEYVYESEGSERQPGNTGHVTWRAKRNATITADVYAQPPADIPVLHEQAAALAAAQGRVDRAFGVGNRVSTMMEAAEAIGERCGDDEACFEREGMKLAQQSQANGQTQTLMNSREDIEAQMQPGDHYQYWGGNFGAGRYAINETIEVTVIDPGSGAPYTQTIRREGSGGLPASVAGVSIPTDGPGILTGVEFDRNSRMLALKLPVPGLTPGTETISGQDSDGRSDDNGSEDKMLEFPVRLGDDQKPMIVEVRGRNWRDQSGEETIYFTEGRWQEKGTLTIRWRFQAR
ncbi:hypothetical protein [Brevundimonas sp.]|uniref:hypothetical protein n=1 Tax=Brevundimonas sp. TaxID=1871086 RepID=UPI00403477C1